MQRIIYTAHARQRLKHRNITKQQVKKVLAEPDITLPTKDPRRDRRKKKFGDRYLDVIFEKRDDYTVIVTAVWSKERRK